MEMNCVNPLVTVCVLTYESSDFVLETLESIKNQTYGNIQLIISDDSSKDSTVSVCQAWLERNMDRFASARIITAESNTGVTANCNRAVKNAEGRWIKLLAGDDILWHDALEILVSRAESLPYDRFFIGGFVQPFSDTQALPRDTSRERELILLGGIGTSEHQLEALRCKNPLFAPTVLLPAAVFGKFCFDETYPFAEDYPMFLHMLEAGYRYINIERPLVRYRIHTNSISNDGRSKKLFTTFYKRKRILEEGLQLPHVGFAVRAKLNHDYNVRLFLDKVGLNRKNAFCQVIFSICLRLNPFFYIGRWAYESKLKKYQHKH